jgi:hypothetical protein
MGKPIERIEQDWQITLAALERNDWDCAKAGLELGKSRQTIESRILSARARGWVEDGPPLEGFRVTGTSTLFDGEGNKRATWLKTARDAPGPEEIASSIRQAFEDYTPPEPSVWLSEPITDSDLATIYICADWHVGLLSWKKETGHNYDLKIGQSTIQTAMERLIAGTPKSGQAVVLGLGDLLHSDNYDNQTSKSKNVLDVDGRYPKILSAATQLLLYTIDLALQKHETVIVRVLPGNHDEHAAIAVSLALSLYYANNPRVSVDDDAGRFWWWSFGKVFLGATHGDKAKMKDLPLIMAARNPEAWGKAKFRHVYTGHIHQQSGIEMSGVTVESFQSPVAPDAWHVAQGYGANRSVQAINYHKADGEISRNKVNIL